MESCIFCKIVNKDVPNYTVFEDADTVSFLDIFPHAKGHTVVIPKRHAETVFDLSDAEFAAVANATKQSVSILQKTLAPEGFNVGWNHGQAGGQAVPHLHVHILPRWSGDGGGNMHSIVKHPGELSPADIVKRIRP